MEVRIILALHLIFVICWMAGMLYLPRLFVYHSRTQDKNTSITFSTMERKLLLYIMNPSLCLLVITGLILAFYYGSFQEGWFHLKFFLVFLMISIHGFLWGYYCRLKKGKNHFSHVFFRILNEIPAILMMIIVFLVIFNTRT